MESTVKHRSDYELVREVLEGSSGALDRFLERMRCIPRILQARNGRRGTLFTVEEIRDLAQETFARLWSRLDSYRGEGSIEAWTYRFCCNVMMGAQQRRRRRPLPVGREQLSPSVVVESEPHLADREALYEAMATLAPPEAEVIELKHFEGLSFTDIANRTRTSPNSAKTRYYRGMQRLRHLLSPLFREEGP